ncbi:uncharacterized protein LACBIDRAFT_333861 [Laccaria bicolor S238N-H82]|uniref:Predicted protein n=1 Tax=Laccaria bicolor (strain S238N-H82 / ATCC MYA-4686) TaxID=486041 RepID=B0DXB2_LACBS|nr:uncharacterized protein LACBIDRAFT_333861 [Laccaria bicolor S238N-H82]EDR00805.1 predicted protein [Laccaria bicolor S238N-H82]|eukprot:XP_001888597.1 predicted protein [Laccaria bicolor S238N-H82]
MLKFDHFFQDLCSEGRPDPTVEFNDEWTYYVVDFQGWSRRRIPLCVAREYYVRFGSNVGHEAAGTMVLFRRWEPLNNFATSSQPTESMEVEGNISMVRDSLEIRELHRSKHTPVHNAICDWEGQPTSSRAFSQTHYNRGRNRERGRNRASSTGRRWLRQMTNADVPSEGGSQSELRSSPSYSSKGHGSNTPSRSSSRAGTRNRSASPGLRTYQPRRGTSPSLRRHAIDNIVEAGAIITYVGSVWEAPAGLEWNVTFHQESIILFPDTRTLTRLKYWAVTSSEISHTRHLLDLAIARNMCFIMATRISDLKSFRPIMTPDLAELTKRTYEAGFQEEHLKDVNGGAAFRDHLDCKAIRRIGLGSTIHGWTTQVTVHHRGAVTSSPFFDDPLFHDQMSAQEENLVHGFVSAENSDYHRWLFPTTEIMEDFCDHWSGEWTEGCDLIFHNIAKALERGTAKPLTRKGWKSYLHSTNHGTRRPTVTLNSSHFTRVDELLSVFPDPWHGRCIADISIPSQM